MRVISQSGKYDFSYENIILERMGDSNSIFAYTGMGAPYEVARYSSEEKAEKAMEMCRSKYASFKVVGIFFNGVASDCHKEELIQKIMDNIASASAFQFPADEDVEV